MQKLNFIDWEFLEPAGPLAKGYIFESISDSLEAQEYIALESWAH